MSSLKATKKLVASPQKKSLSSKLCVLCQEKGGELVKPENINSKKLQEIVDSLKEHEKYQTSIFEQKYRTVLEKIDKHDGATLKEGGFSYHSTCRSNLSKSKVNYQRIEARLEKEEKEEKRKTDRVQRSSGLIFDKTACIFCQSDSNELLYKMSTLTCNKAKMLQELKKAFEECPITLAHVRIRYESAFDTVAWGDEVPFIMLDIQCCQANTRCCST